MDRIRITGGVPLEGDIPISGAKNAALPLMTASLLTDGPLQLSNLPHLMDISTLADLLTSLGVDITMEGDADDDGTVGSPDLIAVILDWGSDGSGNGGDVNGDGVVDISDLLTVILGWGTCAMRV